MFIKNLFRLKEIKVKPKDYIISYFFGGWLSKSKLHRYMMGGVWYKYLTFDRGGNNMYFWSIIPDLDKGEFDIVTLVKVEKYK